MDQHLQVNNDVLDSLKSTLGLSTDKELAERIGVSQNGLSLIRQGTFPGKRFQTWAYRTFGEVPGLYYIPRH